ncbi:MAG: helix-turn-helix domain-containing protein [Butyrivibrio sp.]|nr:helix-turn-helix domain-containing protein [Butyrivibrio sp.]
MAKNTIGQFIAALRKANGMTQQEVAERLNVSNKAVSRWERDECAPDLSLIPAIAEMFGVTCDELLKGERILEPSSQEKKEPRVEKQLKSLINKTLSDFKTLIWVSLAVAVGGLICMFGISYGFYRPVIGFAVMLLFEAGAFVLAVLAVNKAKAVKNGNELFEEASEELTGGFDRALGSFSFTAFFAVISVVILSLPLVIITSDYVESVLSLSSYFIFFFLVLVLILAAAFLKFRKPYMEWISGSRQSKEARAAVRRRVLAMDAAQLGLLVLAGLCYTVVPLFGKNNAAFEVGPIAALIFIAANIVCFVLFLVKNKEGRREFIIPGIRNIFLSAPIWILGRFHAMGISYDDDMAQTESYHVWNWNSIWYAAASVIAVFAVFALIDALVKRKSKSR